MKKDILMFTVFAVITLMFQYAGALTIISPTEGQVVYQGDKLTVIVKPDVGEELSGVDLEMFPMPYNAITKEYKQEIGIPATKIGAINFSVTAYYTSGEEVKLNRSLLVKMPPNVVLQSIITENIMILYKAPSDMNPDEKKTFEERQIAVAGVYSDGFNRQITSSGMGTSYISSDEKIVNVDSEGKVTPQALGTAKITVRNSKYSATVKVIVKPYRK